MTFVISVPIPFPFSIPIPVPRFTNGCACFFTCDFSSDIYAKFNLQVYYPPLYEKVVWHNKHANTDHIKKDTRGFNWERSFANKDVNEMVNIFNETMSNVLNNYILHDTIICDDQDHPWINNKVKNAMQEKNQLFSRVKLDINNGTLLKKLQ